MLPQFKSPYTNISMKRISKKPYLIFYFLLLWYTTTNFICHKRKESFTFEDNTGSLIKVSVVPPISSTDTVNPLEEFNKKYCGQSECKFLFAYTHGEQETQANLHYRSFCQLAEKLNRIMILTNVGSSKIETCKNFPFDFYYDTKSLQKIFPNVIFKTEEEFIFWLQERDRIKKKVNSKDNEIVPPLSILHSNIRAYGITKKTTYRDIKSNNLYGCLSKFEPLMNLTDPNNSNVRYSVMDIGKTEQKTEKSRAKFSQLLVSLLSIDEEILLINEYVLHPLFPKIMPAMSYSEYILSEAQKIKDKLSSSYIGIHWRLEQSRSELLPECVQGLIKKLNQVMKEEGIKNIYLATDYPLLSSSSQSDTFLDINRYHHDAIKTLNETFKINTWVSLGGLEQLRNDRKYNTEFISSGIQGILDKLVCMNSNYFISGPQGCSRILSTFTRVIAEERGNRIENNSDILNVIDRWEIF